MGAADVAFHRDAIAEYEEAFGWYFSRSPEVATRFEREVERALHLIVEAPARWPACDDIHRRILPRRFPYLMVYREHQGRLWVVAVAHGHRRPRYRENRVIDG